MVGRHLAPRSRRLIVAAAAAVVMASGAAVYAYASSPSTPSVISACVQQENGNVRVLLPDSGRSKDDKQDTSCSRNEKALSWNQQGVQGSPGPAGPTGPQGPKGDKGDTGPAGATGLVGPAGPQGPKGDKGNKGDPGATGPQGPKGDTGAAGAAGAPGAAGKDGAAGAAGPQGPKGDKGDAGAPGATGAQGPIGQTGATGPQGATGAQGPKGDTGPQGAQGIPGPGTKTKAGVVEANATVLSSGGSGFTVTHLATGRYRVDFPAGTWNASTFPAAVVQPISGGPATLTNYGAFGDGSSTFTIEMPADSGFFFIVAQP